MSYEYDYGALRGRIKEKFGTEKKFADVLNISHTGISNKLNNKVDFTQSEIDKACRKDVLDIDKSSIWQYFFKRKVEFNSTNTEK